MDTKWGIGLAQDHPHAKRRDMWRGENRLGEVLTEVRDKMLENGDVGDATLVQHFTDYSVANIMCVFRRIFLDD